jgi:nucleotide-binding universal stress UspA family protein
MKILLPIDGSDCANHTLEWVAKTFDKQNTEYYLLFVIPVLPDLNTVEFDIVEANAMLRKARNLLEGKGCMVVSTDYSLGEVVDQICGYADEIDADQIVIGSHGRTGWSKLLMGSTSIRLLEQSHRPVTLHRNIERPVRERGVSSSTVI